MMLIQVDSEIAFVFPKPTVVVLMLYLHPSVAWKVRTPERLTVDPAVNISDYHDVYGNRCGRVFVPAGHVVFRHSAVVEDDGQPDPQVWGAYQSSMQELPDDTFMFLLPSRYCEVDSELKEVAWKLFGHQPAGWPLVQAVCDFVHGHVRFDYQQGERPGPPGTSITSGSASAAISCTWRSHFAAA